MEIHEEMMEIPAYTAAGLFIKLPAGDVVYLSDDGAWIEICAKTSAAWLIR